MPFELDGGTGFEGGPREFEGPWGCDVRGGHRGFEGFPRGPWGLEVGSQGDRVITYICHMGSMGLPGVACIFVTWGLWGA